MEVTEQDRADAAERLRIAQDLFNERFERAMRAQHGNPPAACGQLFTEAADDPDLCRAIVLLHLTYFVEGLGRHAGQTEPAATMVN